MAEPPAPWLKSSVASPFLSISLFHCATLLRPAMVTHGKMWWNHLKLSMLMVNSRKDCQKMSIDTVCSSLLLDHFPTSFPGFSLVFHCVFLISSEATSISSRRFSPGNSPGPAALPSNRISTTWSALLRSERGKLRQLRDYFWMGTLHIIETNTTNDQYNSNKSQWSETDWKLFQPP